MERIRHVKKATHWRVEKKNFGPTCTRTRDRFARAQYIWYIEYFHSIRHHEIRPTLAAYFCKTDRVHQKFFPSSKTSIYIEAIYEVDQNFNRRKICYEFSKLGKKSSFFCYRVQNFENFKTFFLHLRSTHRDIQNVYKQCLAQINYFARRTKNCFCPILGGEKGLPPISTPRGDWGQNFFSHNGGLGWTLETRLLLPETRNRLQPQHYCF